MNGGTEKKMEGRKQYRQEGKERNNRQKRIDNPNEEG